MQVEVTYLLNLCRYVFQVPYVGISSTFLVPTLRIGIDYRTQICNGGTSTNKHDTYFETSYALTG